MTPDGARAARIFLASFLVLFLEVALIRWMPAYIRLLVVLLELHPARQLSRHRRRLPSGIVATPAVCLVPVRAAPGRAGRLVPAAGGSDPDIGEHLLHQRHDRRRRRGREHDAPAAPVRHGRGALRHAGAADGERDVGEPSRCAATRSIWRAASPASPRSASCRGSQLSPTWWFGARVRCRRSRCS